MTAMPATVAAVSSTLNGFTVLFVPDHSSYDESYNAQKCNSNDYCCHTDSSFRYVLNPILFH